MKLYLLIPESYTRSCQISPNKKKIIFVFKLCTAVEVMFAKLCEYASNSIWSAKVKSRSKFGGLGILMGETCLLLCLLESLAYCYQPAETIVETVAFLKEGNKFQTAR